MLKKIRILQERVDEFNEACDGLLCAINDNPKAEKKHKPKIQHHRAVAHVGIFGVSFAWLSKVIGLH